MVSFGTEFIENESEDVEKQDCEINVAKRLLGRLKRDIPRCHSTYRGMPFMRWI